MRYGNRETYRGTGTVRGVAQSTVTAAKTLTVLVNGTVVTCQAARALVVLVGDMVVGFRDQSQIVIVAVLGATAPTAAGEDQAPPPPVEPDMQYGRLAIYPVETRSYRDTGNGWREDTDDTYQGNYGDSGNHTGCAFYGTKPASLSGATVTGVTVEVKRVSANVYADRTTTMTQITNKTKPAGAPTLTGSTIAGPLLEVGESDTFTLPEAWGQGLVDGTTGGMALFAATGTPYVRLAGRGVWSPAFLLTIDWKRAT